MKDQYDEDDDESDHSVKVSTSGTNQHVQEEDPMMYFYPPINYSENVNFGEAALFDHDSGDEDSDNEQTVEQSE